MKTAAPPSARGRFLLRLLQGFLIGLGGILPGISGALLAVVFGVYRPMMDTLAHPKRNLPRYGRLFLPLLLGAAAGFFGGSGALLVLFRRSETAAVSLFLGLIAGTLPALWREAGAQGRTRRAYAAAALCFALALLPLLLLRLGVLAPLRASFPALLLGGAIFGLGMIVPGLAAAPLLMALALFSPMVRGALALDVPVLLPWALGALVAVALCARAVSWLFRAHAALAGHAVFGIVLASLLTGIPTRFASSSELAFSLLFAALGLLGALWGASLRPPVQTDAA